MPVHDPYYASAPAQWLTRRVRSVGIDVRIYDALTAPAAVEPDGSTIWVRPGLELVDYHWMLARGSLFARWGPRVCPDFIVRPHANVMPLRPRKVG